MENTQTAIPFDMKSNQQTAQVDCIIPAAGLSSRMGDWKLMLPYKEATILDHSIENALMFCARVILVVGHRAQELCERYAAHSRVDIIVNNDYKMGMFSSIQQGVKRVTSDYFFITHGDMPTVTSAVFDQLWQNRGAYALFPGDEHHSGHPVLLPQQYISYILAADNDSKMKTVLANLDNHYLQLDELCIGLDVDTPEAYQALLRL